MGAKIYVNRCDKVTLHVLINSPDILVISGSDLRWVEIVSWRARPGPLIARARVSTPGSRKCKFSDLVPSKILQNLYFDRKHL